MEPKLFSVEEANRLLPKVAPHVAELRKAHGAMRDAEAAVAALVKEHGETTLDRPDHPERARYWQLVAQAREAEEKVQGLLDEVRFLGAEVKDLDLGLVDFRHKRGGEVVHLCWRLGEARIGFWHDLAAGFAGRKPIEELEQRKG